MQAMKILVPVDGSDASTRALRHALALCKAFRSGKLLVVAVDDSLFPGAERKMGAEAAAAHHAENFERMLGPARKLLARRKVKAEFIELVGDVAASILEAAAAKKADVIVMGSRGAGGIKGVLLGSVSQKVLAGTPVPVTIVN
ncbi:universal stress protein [Luteimonas wenzhouensis]|jgi:nucleotide-binding universal stress UspA family protein|uniref:Universal stress protein n=2 Tax=Luteimonas wenzhouensis TaxID=2599615 RepID=A0A5C5U465_9GAMM|nr:universal stress protein [Luteimonas wenzhouensis]